jgi:uncharacterized membrane protein
MPMNMPQGMGAMPGMAFTAGFFIVYMLIMLMAILVWVFFLVACWRAMRAHESIADSLRYIASRPLVPAPAAAPAPPQYGSPPAPQ